MFRYSQGLLADLGTMKRNIELLKVTMENLAETVHELEEFLLIVDSIMASMYQWVNIFLNCCQYV